MQLYNTKVGLQPSDPLKYWDPVTARVKALQNYLDTNQVIQDRDYVETVKPEFDWVQKANQLGQDTSQTTYNSAINQSNNDIMMNAQASADAAAAANNNIWKPKKPKKKTHNDSVRRHPKGAQ